MERNRYRVMFDSARREWVVVIATSERFKTKKDAVVFAVGEAEFDSDFAGLTGEACPAQVVIHKKNGQIQEERTYPRSTDPRRSRG